MFALHYISQIVYAESLDTELIIRAKFFYVPIPSPSPDPGYIRYLQIDGQNDRQKVGTRNIDDYSICIGIRQK